jgi:hypothetical protein
LAQASISALNAFCSVQSAGQCARSLLQSAQYVVLHPLQLRTAQALRTSAAAAAVAAVAVAVAVAPGLGVGAATALADLESAGDGLAGLSTGSLSSLRVRAARATCRQPAVTHGCQFASVKYDCCSQRWYLRYNYCVCGSAHHTTPHPTPPHTHHTTVEQHK